MRKCKNSIMNENPRCWECGRVDDGVIVGDINPDLRDLKIRARLICNKCIMKMVSLITNGE